MNTWGRFKWEETARPPRAGLARLPKSTHSNMRTLYSCGSIKKDADMTTVSTPQHQLVHSYDQWSPAKENVLNIFVSS